MSEIKTGVLQNNSFQLNKDRVVNTKPVSINNKESNSNKIVENNSSNFKQDDFFSNSIKNIARSATAEVNHIEKIVSNPSSLLFPDKKIETPKNKIEADAMGIRG